MAGVISAGDGVTIYNLTTSRKVPEWISGKRKRQLKNDPEFTRRIDLLQDFGFPSAAHTVQQSPDGRFIIATGIYAPRVRVYDTAELSMKFERYMDATPVATSVLSEDYSKLAFLQDDRTIELHAAYGKHFRTRIPHFGRCMAYHHPTAELLVGGASPDVYRLSLEEGRFAAPMRAPVAPVKGLLGAAIEPGVNALAVSRVTALVGAGSDGGYVTVFDPRTCKAAARLLVTSEASARLPDAAPHADAAPSADADYSAFSDGTSITALAFDDGGLSLAAGTRDGRVLLYDLRRAAPLLVKSHQYGLPIKKVLFHRRDAASSLAGSSGSSDIVISADSKVVKMWHREGVSYSHSHNRSRSHSHSAPILPACLPCLLCFCAPSLLMPFPHPLSPILFPSALCRAAPSPPWRCLRP